MGLLLARAHGRERLSFLVTREKGAAGLEARVEIEGLGGWRCVGQWLAKIEDEDGWQRE